MKRHLSLFAISAAIFATASAETVLTDEHVDLNIGYTRTSGVWTIKALDNDVDPARQTSPATTLLYVDPAARVTRPGNPAFDFVGVGAGQPYYQLPQAQNPSLLYLGFAGYGASSADFDAYNPAVESGGRASGFGRWLKVSLVAVRGPGDFAVWQNDDEGPNVFMSTADGGITAGDSLWILASGHLHFNWSFTTEGIYEVDFRLSGHQENNDSSLGPLIQSPGVFTMRFGVDAVPEPAPLALLFVAGLAMIGFGNIRRRACRALPLLAAAIAFSPLARAGLAVGYVEVDAIHADIAMPFIGTAATGGWQTFVHTGNVSYAGNYAPDAALLMVNASTRTTRPADPKFDFLGVAAGAPIWKISDSQVPGQLYLGVEADYGFSSGRMEPSTATNWKSWDPDGAGPAFNNRYVMLNVVGVRGPGSFSVYDYSGTNDLQVRVASADGLGALDGMPQLIRSHSHYDWVFTAPGQYEVDFQARSFLGPNSGAGPEILSPMTTFYFNVAAVPEPSAVPLAIAALLAGLVIVRRFPAKFPVPRKNAEPRGGFASNHKTQPTP